MPEEDRVGAAPDDGELQPGDLAVALVGDVARLARLVVGDVHLPAFGLAGAGVADREPDGDAVGRVIALFHVRLPSWRVNRLLKIDAPNPCELSKEAVPSSMLFSLPCNRVSRRL